MVANVNNGGLSTGLWNAIDTDALDTLTDSRQEGCHNPWQFAERVFRGPHRRRIGPEPLRPFLLLEMIQTLGPLCLAFGSGVKAKNGPWRYADALWTETQSEPEAGKYELRTRDAVIMGLAADTFTFLVF